MVVTRRRLNLLPRDRLRPCRSGAQPNYRRNAQERKQPSKCERVLTMVKNAQTSGFRAAIPSLLAICPAAISSQRRGHCFFKRLQNRKYSAAELTPFPSVSRATTHTTGRMAPTLSPLALSPSHMSCHRSRFLRGQCVVTTVPFPSPQPSPIRRSRHEIKASSTHYG